MVNNLMNKNVQFRGKILDLSTPKVMGILNVTPDSFSDGGRFNNIDAALRHCEQLIGDGAHIIDIGGESTRPNAAIVGSDEEMARVLPVVVAIRARFGDEIWLSLDTSNPTLMQAGIEAGADMINDVRALARDGAAQTAAALSCPVVLMHSRGEPDTMNDLAVYADVLDEIKDELDTRISTAMAAGVRRENIIVDIGMGFAKNFNDHREIMRHLDELVTHFGRPMLFGVSRKRFLGEILTRSSANLQNHTPSDRDTLGAAMSLMAAARGANIVRVHDVAQTAQMLSMWTQIFAE